ncbi:MAG: hypothetical protein GF390_02620 [Candidatus Pacebacteria bacterium]|nr:hypothetical protein [Candidatus Paceibacterota bacterium]
MLNKISRKLTSEGLSPLQRDLVTALIIAEGSLSTDNLCRLLSTSPGTLKQEVYRVNKIMRQCEPNFLIVAARGWGYKLEFNEK